MKATASIIAALLDTGNGGSVTEAEFQDAVIGLARANGWRCAHFRKVRIQRKGGAVYWETPVAADGRGFPDLICTRRDRLLALELKVGRNKATPEQEAWLAAFDQCGAECAVLRPSDWPAIRRILA